MTIVFPPHAPAKRRRPRIDAISLLFRVVLVLIMLFLIGPTLMVVPLSLGDADYLQFPPEVLTKRWYTEVLTDRAWLDPLFFSLRIALLSTVVATIAGAAAAYALDRFAWRATPVIMALAIAPVVVPHVVLGVGLFASLANMGLLGTTLGFVIADSALTVSFVMISVAASLRTLDKRLTLAARSMGANEWTVFWSVIFPAIRPGVVAGSIFAFVTAFDEATISFFISGISAKPLPRKLFEDIDYSLSPAIAAMATVISFFTLAVIAWAALRQFRQR